MQRLKPALFDRSAGGLFYFDNYAEGLNMYRQWIKNTAKQRMQYSGYGTAILVGLVATLLGAGIQLNIPRVEIQVEGGAQFNWNMLNLPGIHHWGQWLGWLSLLLSGAALLYLFFVSNVLRNGYYGWFLRYSRGETMRTGQLFDSFRIYQPVLATTALRTVKVFLWSLLFVIPGIVMGYAYSMADYIIYENPNLSASQALDMSRRMTQGYKGELFVFDLSFFGWELLSALTLGILGIVYVNPYYATAHAYVYESLKRRALDAGVLHPGEFGMPTAM